MGSGVLELTGESLLLIKFLYLWNTRMLPHGGTLGFFKGWLEIQFSIQMDFFIHQFKPKYIFAEDIFVDSSISKNTLCFLDGGKTKPGLWAPRGVKVDQKPSNSHISVWTEGVEMLPSGISGANDDVFPQLLFSPHRDEVRNSVKAIFPPPPTLSHQTPGRSIGPAPPSPNDCLNRSRQTCYDLTGFQSVLTGTPGVRRWKGHPLTHLWRLCRMRRGSRRGGGGGGGGREGARQRCRRGGGGGSLNALAIGRRGQVGRGRRWRLQAPNLRRQLLLGGVQVGHQVRHEVVQILVLQLIEGRWWGKMICFYLQFRVCGFSVTQNNMFTLLFNHRDLFCHLNNSFYNSGQ